MEQLPYDYQPDGVAYSGAVLQEDADGTAWPVEDAGALPEGEPNDEDAEANASKDARRKLGRIRGFCIRVIALVAFIYVLFFWVVGIGVAGTADMYPRIDAGDLMLYYRLDTDVSAGDVIVFDKGGSQRIGRVVARESDTVSITDQEKLVVNGSTVSETNIFSSTPRYEGFVEYPLTLGAGECFVLADNRHGGEDSRYFGPVSKSEIKGTVITIIRRNNL